MKITKATTKVELTREEAENILSRVQKMFSTMSTSYVEYTGENEDIFEEDWNELWLGRTYAGKSEVPHFRNELTVTICG